MPPRSDWPPPDEALVPPKVKCRPEIVIDPRPDWQDRAMATWRDVAHRVLAERAVIAVDAAGPNDDATVALVTKLNPETGVLEVLDTIRLEPGERITHWKGHRVRGG